MALNLNNNYPIVRVVLLGTLIISTLLLGLLLLHDITTTGVFRTRTFIITVCITYLSIALILYHKNYTLLSSWMIMGFYLAVMTTMLLLWGLNAPVSILSVAFAIFLSGILFGPKVIVGVSISSAVLLAFIQVLHEVNLIAPRVNEINTRATLWDAASYIIIFAIFGLLSWLSSTRIKATLKRAQAAETTIREQRNIIRAELENEHARARQNRLIEIERLYKFATLGQSTAATLHELSNHLSVLNMDIEDLTQQHKNSKAIIRARESIDHINSVMRHVRRRLNIAHENDEPFSVLNATRVAIKDARSKLQQRNIKFITEISPEISTINLQGDPLSWSHIITILITNALEACQDLVQPKVLLQVSKTNTTLVVNVLDNGIGILATQRKALFQPVHSTKPNGMGIGLYVTKHIIESQFHGTIQYTSIGIGSKAAHKSPFESGSKFTIKIPLEDKSS